MTSSFPNGFPNNGEPWTPGQQQLFIQRYDGSSMQNMHSRYLRNPNHNPLIRSQNGLNNYSEQGQFENGLGYA